MPQPCSRRTTLLLSLSAAFGLVACGGGSGGGDADPQGWSTVTTLRINDDAIGTGTQADTGKTVSVHYTGYIVDVRGVASSRGAKFDTSVGKSPLSFKIGAGSVIAGLEQGVTGMKVGGKRMITIPASLAYGSSGFAGVIPPNAALIFDVELLSVS